uniref:Tyrosinase n=1 Tax=Streptomyces galbus TaxID=33898 RepID=TYRO_STRGB|nr:RecName: Full=Tyrosinase; AltName: Full=Monophenol monooxygenase [Streptomyces galbus]pir/T52526/ monophenol monooxygenase (EC 1.14.18.1) [imported] - Streptomyces galbus [Streptomyces galbus]CAA65005.1 Tyrosinase [Streptomyces galbus]
MTVRKNQAALTADEKRRFVAAVLELKRNGRYDEFVRTHNEFIMSDTRTGRRGGPGHRLPLPFLPWHRRFLLDFEQALQSVDSSVALPYWDWSTDRTVRASLWAPDFLGGTGRSSDGRVMDGPFAASTGNWPVNVRVDGRTFLRRSLGTGVRELPTRAEVDSVLSMATYDMAPYNSASDGFRNHLEGWRGVNLHNRVHVWVGGQMATGVSPNDPVFWLHHAYNRQLWAEWQRRHPGAGYVPTGGTPDVVDLNDTMKPWNDVRPADLLTHTAHYTFDV